MGNPVQTIAWGLIQAARRLDDAQRAPGDKDLLLGSVRLNWKLWTIIQADVLDDASLLSLEIRQNLLNLSNFIDKHTVGIITKPNVSKLQILIEINKNIAAGLFDATRAMDTQVIEPNDGVGEIAGSPGDKVSTSA